MVADQCYGVSLQSKVSSLHPLRKKDALNFIASLQSEEEALGEVSHVSTSKFSKLTGKRKTSDQTKNPSESNEVAENEDDGEASATYDDEDDGQVEGIPVDEISA